MIDDRARASLSVAAALAACAFLSAPARAQDAPPAPAAPEHKPIPKIEHAFLDSMVGSWSVAVKTAMGSEAAGVSRVRKAAGGTALVQETKVDAGGRSYRSLGVLRVDGGGKSVKVWRFDTFGGGEVRVLSGALAADGFDASGDEGFAIHAKKKDAGFEATVEMGGQTFSTSTYTKSAKDVEFDAPDAPKDGLRPATIGEWDVAGAWVMPGKDGKPASIPVKGTSSFHWALGGAAIVHDYDMTSPMGPAQAVGVHRWPADGSSTKIWFFSNDGVDPLVAEGPNTDAGWEGKGTIPGEGEMSLQWGKKGDGFEMKFEMGGQPAGSETYTRKK